MILKPWTAGSTALITAMVAVAVHASASTVPIRATTEPSANWATLTAISATSETVCHPISPVRVLDTRTTVGGHLGKVVSNINYLGGQTVANSVTVRLSPTGQMTIRPGNGATHVIVDVAGYYARSIAFGQQAYVGWAVASDAGITSSHSNNGQPVTAEHITLGTNAIVFHGANIGGFLRVHGNLQLSVRESNRSCVTTARGDRLPDTWVHITCRRNDTGASTDTSFYLQLTG